MFNDPSGEYWEAGIFLEYITPIIWTAIVGAAISTTAYLFSAAVTGAVSGGLGQIFSAAGFWATVGNGAIAGSASGGVTALINGDNFLKGLATGAVIGGAVAGVSYSIRRFVQRSSYESKGMTMDDLKNNTDFDPSKVESNYNDNPQNKKLASNISETEKKLFKPNENFGAGEHKLGKAASNGYLDMGDKGAGKFLAYTDQPNFWNGKSDIYYSPNAAVDKYILKFTMLHETGHAYSNMLFLPSVTINIDGFKDTTEHLALYFSEHDVASVNNLTFKPRTYFISQPTLENVLRKLNKIQLMLFNNSYMKFAPIFNRIIN